MSRSLTNRMFPVYIITMPKTIRLTYVSCNKHTIVLIIIFIPCLIITGLLVKLSVYGDYYQKQKSQYCNPVNFFWGNDVPCKKFIKQVVKNAIKDDYRGAIKNESFDAKPVNPLNSTLTDLNIKYNDFKKAIVDNYLAIIDLIQSFNEFVFLLLLKMSKDIINRIFT